MSNYLTYPCKVMNITQGYTGNYSHTPYSTGDPKDYPWDEACENSGRSAMFCPCDEVVIKKIYGVNAKGTNTIWIESTSEVVFADGTSGFFVMLIIHPNDSDLKRLKVGMKFKRGEIICYEGTDGNATGNHFHFSAGKGKFAGNGWRQNSNGKWVLHCTAGTYKPEKLFYIDEDFTTVKSDKGLKFKSIPNKDNFFPARGYFKKGDVSENVGKIASFMYKVFPAYTSKKALGNTYGVNLISSIKSFQSREGITVDGNCGPETLGKLKKYGFKC